MSKGRYKGKLLYFAANDLFDTFVNIQQTLKNEGDPQDAIQKAIELADYGATGARDLWKNFNTVDTMGEEKKVDSKSKLSLKEVYFRNDSE